MRIHEDGFDYLLGALIHQAGRDLRDQRIGKLRRAEAAYFLERVAGCLDGIDETAVRRRVRDILRNGQRTRSFR